MWQPEDLKDNTITAPKAEWIVDIPKNSNPTWRLEYTRLSLWSRIGMRLIGWGVYRNKE